MAASNLNRPWNLEAFLDSLILELDKANDTLSVKGSNRKLTYTVKDLSLNLQIFPEFDGDEVRFKTAGPGETGASTVAIQLGSIRDTQISEITKKPITKDDVSLDVTDIAPEERKELQKLGINSVEDLRRTVEDRNVDIEQVTRRKVNYQKLARVINQARRQQQAPSVSNISISKAQGRTLLRIRGENLATSNSTGVFPVAVLNSKRVEVVEASERQLQIELRDEMLDEPTGQLIVALDPYAIMTLELKS